MLNRLEMLRIFCAAADAGSFKDAAIHLGISPQAVTRAIQELERLQGEMLFHRNTRQVRITSFGEQLAERARTSLQQLDGLFAPDPASPPDDMSGVVRLAAPSALGRSRLLPIVERLANAHPGLRFDLRLTDQRADSCGEPHRQCPPESDPPCGPHDVGPARLCADRSQKRQEQQ